MSEHNDQAAVFAWAALQEGRRPDLKLLYAIPNGAKLPWRRNQKGQRYSSEAMKLKAEGLRSGVPDTCLPVARKGFHGLYIEMKHGRNKPSDNQAWWMDQLTQQGYLAVACWGPQEAIDTLCEYLDL